MEHLGTIEQIRMMKKSFALAVVILALVILPSIAVAMPDPFATLTVWPYDTPEGAEGPIVTTSPADLIIYNNDQSHVLDDFWLLLVINKDAYDHLVSITTNTSLSFLPNHFEEILGTASPSDRIPPVTPYAYGDWIIDPDPAPYADMTIDGWPGIEWNDQYDVGSLRSKLGIADGESMYYSVGDLDDSSGWIDNGPEGLNKGDPEYFTANVNLGVSPPESWKVLVLAVGHTDNYPDDKTLNVHSPYTRSTLIVSELRALLLVLAPMSALGLYKVTKKFRKKHI